MQEEKSKDPNQKTGDILHAGRLGAFSESAASYTSSVDIDGKLLAYVVAINSAHMVMLFENHLVSREVAEKILEALGGVPPNLEMKEELEDVHMNVEDFVISQFGKDVGGMLNLAKSRNDQVATALRMAQREELIRLGKAIVSLERSLQEKARIHASDVMPGYTHLQRGQPVTLGHHILAHFDSLDRDFARLVDCYLRTNLSPMGAGALASSSFPIDRKRVAELLGFDSLLENSLDAVSSRDFATEAIYVASQSLIDLSRLAEEIIIWTTKEFSFAEVSDRHASTSSMMPQKKNAVVPEIFRARSAQVLGDLVASLGLIKSLPLSYNLDLQELTRNLWSALGKATQSIGILSELVRDMRFDVEAMEKAAVSDELLYSTELADFLVRERGLSFREAHGRVGKLVRQVLDSGEAGFSGMRPDVISDMLGVEVSSKEISQLVSPASVLKARKALGSPSPELVAAAARARLETIAKHEETLAALEEKLLESRKMLSDAAEKLTEKSPQATTKNEARRIIPKTRKIKSGR